MLFSSNSWKKQLGSELFKNYQLIAIDLPAHGALEESANPEQDYSLPRLGRIIAYTIKALANNNSYLLAGISLGTNILAESLAFGLRPKVIVLDGRCIIGGKYGLENLAKPNTNVYVVITERSPEAEIKNMLFKQCNPLKMILKTLSLIITK